MVEFLKKNKNRVIYAGAFLIPVICFLVSYIAMGIAPFGNKGAMIIDSYHQYVPLFSEFHDKIWHGDSFQYSWHGGMGFDFVSVMAYYLASPLNILLAVFPDRFMVEAFECLIILKTGLAGLTACIYLAKHSGKFGYSTALFADFYALGGFLCAYNWNVMWLDSFALFPLAVLGAEYLIDRKDARLYIISLGLIVFCNYYIAIMVCIFMVLYFFAYWFSRKRNGIGALISCGVRYGVSSILAGGLAGVLLFPTYYTLINSSQGTKPSEWKIYWNFLDVFGQHFVMTEPTQLNGTPNIYCGILCIMLIVFYAFSKKISRREKICRLVLTAFIFVSLNVNVLDYIWHGFHFPNNLPGRFSFLYIFMVITMAYDAWQHTGKASFIIHTAAAAICGLVFCLCMIVPSEKPEIYSSIATGILLVLYVGCLMLEKNKASMTIKGVKIKARHAMCLIMMVELGMNSIYCLLMNGDVNRDSYMKSYSDNRSIREKYEPVNTFYRMELDKIQGRDDITRYHMNGISLFSSTCDDRMEEQMGAIGYYKAGNKFTYKGSTPLTDSITGIRYVIGNGDIIDPGENLVKIDTVGAQTVYENMLPLSVGFMIGEDIREWQMIEGEPFVVQNDFCRLASDTDQIVFRSIYVDNPEINGGEITGTDENKWFYDMKGKEGNLKFKIEADPGEDLYIYFSASHCENLKVIKDGVITTYSDEKGHIVHLGVYEEDSDISLEFSMNDDYDSGNVKLQAYLFDPHAYSDIYGALSDEQLNITSADSTHISGDINVKEDGVMMISIPYSDGWDIMVDGEKTDKFTIGSAFTGIGLSKGSHSIQMKYTSPGLLKGALVSLISLILVIILCYSSQKIDILFDKKSRKYLKN